MENNNRQGCRWVKASGQSKEDGWAYDADFLRTITEKVNEQEWGETLSMEEVEAVLKVIESIEPCATSSENYWKQRCEAAEDGLRNLIFTAQKLWDDAKPIKDTGIMKVTHPTIESAKQLLNL